MIAIEWHFADNVLTRHKSSRRNDEKFDNNINKFPIGK
jgi:hypothetical protein